MLQKHLSRLNLLLPYICYCTCYTCTVFSLVCCFDVDDLSIFDPNKINFVDTQQIHTSYKRGVEILGRCSYINDKYSLLYVFNCYHRSRLNLLLPHICYCTCYTCTVFSLVCCFDVDDLSIFDPNKINFVDTQQTHTSYKQDVEVFRKMLL